MWGDQGYVGQTEVIRQAAPRARDCTHRHYRYKDRVDEVKRAKNRNKARVRSKGRARIPGTEIKIRVREGPLPRAQEERQSIVYCLRPGEPVYGS